MTPEAKKRMEHLSHDISDAAEALGFESGYKAGMQDPDAQKELLDECERTLQTVAEIFARDHDKIIGLIGVTLNKLKAGRGGY